MMTIDAADFQLEDRFWVSNELVIYNPKGEEEMTDYAIMWEHRKVKKVIRIRGRGDSGGSNE